MFAPTTVGEIIGYEKGHDGTVTQMVDPNDIKFWDYKTAIETIEVYIAQKKERVKEFDLLRKYNHKLLIEKLNQFDQRIDEANRNKKNKLYIALLDAKSAYRVESFSTLKENDAAYAALYEKIHIAEKIIDDGSISEVVAYAQSIKAEIEAFGKI